MMEHLLEKLEKSSRRQLLFTKILCVLCAVVVVCSVVMTVAVTGAAKQLVALAEPMQEVAGQVKEMAGQAETVMANLDTVSQALANADLTGMVDGINTLAAASQTAVAEAMEKIDTIDIDTLNKAIQDLAAVVEPLARVSSIFG